MSLRQTIAKLGHGRIFPLLVAFTAGALTVSAFAPFSIYPAALLGPALLFLVLVDTTPRQGFSRGFTYGLGLMGFGVFWMHISIDQFGNIGLPGAIALTLVFVAVIAFFYGLLGRLACQYSNRPMAFVFWMPALWVLVEWFRGWVFGGFPWLVLGYSQADTALSGYAPVLGVYGISWLLVLSAGLILLPLLKPSRGHWLALFLLPMIWVGGYWAQHISWTTDRGAPFQVSMIQGNVPQMDKWKPEQLSPTLALYLGATRAHWDSDLIIWPETAVPAFVHVVDHRLIKPLAKEALTHNSEILMGIPVWQTEGRRYFNGLIQLKAGGLSGQYLKRHLVPFGEFMPLDNLLRPILTWMNIPMSNFTPGADHQPLVKLAGYPAGLSICYEDAFGSEVAEALPNAAFLVNVSNDAWFGDSLAPYQHLEIARMRALETERYLLRSTNTGVSALIDHKGRVVDRSPPFEQHVLTGHVIPKAGATPFVQFGNAAIVSLMLLLIATFHFVVIRRSVAG